MKVIICGAGQVGFNIARHLAHEKNDVTVIDRSEELINKVRNSLDVHAIVGYASYPDLLESAGAEDADMIIAVTLFDEFGDLVVPVVLRPAWWLIKPTLRSLIRTAAAGAVDALLPLVRKADE